MSHVYRQPAHERLLTPSTIMTSAQTNGFPPGYFVIKSVATDRLLDVAQDDIEDGTEIILWPERETSLVETRRIPEANNQVFFIDTSGALCSRSSGHAIDIEGERLVLRHRKPVSYPFPNSYSHPVPTFSYSPDTGEISVHFTCDPAYPSSGTGASDAWKIKSYILISIPLRKPRTIIDDASEFFSSAFSTPLSLFSGIAPVPQAKPEEVFSGTIDLDENEVVDEERGDEGEVDDSYEPGRKVRMLAIIRKQESDKTLGEKARVRRQWKVISLRRHDARTNG